ncbi:hypothetical protein VP01_907g4 [Puccinia sorghi]|uniref:HAT C-terminal dimerisation domain-containing protein n=1 Tax=Puccinia sorghi TaxID=27349 RepID=A0A0L6U7N6_9BASI|nr:hypothetical protein VP01_907g4 [Puccinia sorghi]
MGLLQTNRNSRSTIQRIMIPDKSGGTKSMGNHLERKHRLSKSDPPPLTPITVSLAPPNGVSAVGLGSSKRRLNRDALMTAITKFFISNNLPPQTIHDHQFIQLLHLCNPSITRSLLFKPHTLTQSILLKFKIAKQSLKERLAKLSSHKLSFSCTRSTPSDRNHSLIAVVVHWVSDQATLKSVLLGLIQLNRHPSCRNIAHAIFRLLSDYNLQERIFSLTIDNVPDIGEFGDLLASLIPGFNPESQLIGCMGSLINHSAESVLRPLFPLAENDESSAGYAIQLANPMSHHQTAHLSSIISRLQDLTLLLRQSPQKCDSFNRIVGAVTNDPQAGLVVTQINSRWNSTYQVLIRAYQVKEAIQIFCLKENGFAELNIHDQEWEKVRQVCDFLKPMNTAANEISSDKPCDMVTATPTFCWLLRRLGKVRRNYEGRELLKPIKEMLDKLNSHQENTRTKAVHIFAMILDPRIKMSNFEDNSANPENVKSDIISLEEIQKAFYESSKSYSLYPIFRDNQIHDVIVNAPVNQLTENHEMIPTDPNHHQHNKRRTRGSHHHPNPPSGSDSDSDYESGKPRIFKKKPKLMIGLKDEITNYLELECEESNCNPLEYWKANSTKFPSLSQMSKDFLAVQSTTGLAFRSCSKFNQLLDSYLSVSERSGHNNNNPNQPACHNAYESDYGHHHHQDFSQLNSHHPGPSNQDFTSAGYVNTGQIHEAQGRSTNSGNNNNTANLLDSSSFGLPHVSVQSADRMAGFGHPFQSHPSATTTTNVTTSHNTNNNHAHEKDIIVNTTTPPALPLLCQPPSLMSVNPSSSTSSTSTPTNLLAPAFLHHHQHPLEDAPSFLSSTTADSESNLDLLDSYGLANHLFLACEASVCLLDWAFVHAFVDL